MPEAPDPRAIPPPPDEPPARAWAQIEELFERVQGLSPDLREAVLAEADADEALRAEVEALARASTAERALAIERLVRDEPTPERQDRWVGERLGPWRLSRVLGHGGMGIVHAASRCDGQFDLDVAVKVLRTGPRDPLAKERFRTERQLLASLRHPCIAGLIDGGIAEDGTPYLVMELVDGVPVTQWAVEGNPSRAERLRLFVRICDAVQHAHRALVVHRDLKPPNILVNRTGDVKLLDFGIAKLLEPASLGVGVSETQVEFRALTPAYAAPEQRRGEAVTTATDVYALGMLLHELLTGGRPGSTAVGVTGDDAARVPREITSIIRKATAEDPDRRYGSAGQLGEDVVRYMEGRPVLARPDTVGYRIGTFAKRNPVTVALAATFVLSLCAFAVTTAWQARVLSEQRRAAQHERDTARQVVAVLVDLFQSTNPSVRPDGDRMPVGEFLSGAEARSLELLADAPDVRARLLQVFGRIHLARGASDAARASLEDAMALGRAAGVSGAEEVDVLVALGEAWQQGGDAARARSLIEEALRRVRASVGDGDPRTATVLHALAPAVAAVDFDRAGTLLSDALAIRQAAQPRDDRAIAESLAAFGEHHYRRGDLDAARGFFEEALAVSRKPALARNPATVQLLGNYAALLGALHRHEDAAAIQREAIALAGDVLGPTNMTRATQLNNLGVTMQMLGRHGDAETHYRESHDVHHALLGPSHLRTRNAARGVGRALELQGRATEALDWFDRAVAPPVADDVELRAGVWGMRAQRARVLSAAGRVPEALREASEAVEALERLADA